MKQRGFGRIVNIASRVALGRGGLTMYGASKAAVIGFTRGWALELARFGITVNCVAPGPIDTPSLAETAPPDSDARKNILAGVPMGRVGLPQEVAAAVCYFAATDAGFTTGQTLYVCGGATVGLAGI
jgi:NAD(P)-dependent dehydrogenase (short-subunit alcohol dehydrogenase family)